MDRRIIWVSAETPDRDGHGGQRRQYHLINVLQRAGFDIEVAIPPTRQDRTSIETLVSVSVVSAVPVCQAIVRPSPFDRLIEVRRPDAVIVAHTASLRLLPRTLWRPPVSLFVDMQNVDSRWQREVGNRPAARRAQRWESAALKRSAVLVCSERERAALLEFQPGAKVIIVRQGLDPTEWPPRCEAHVPGTVFAFFGSLWYPINLDGLRWFVSNVWPTIRRTSTDAELWIFGPGLGKELDDAGNGIQVKGWVDHLAPALHQTDALVVPILAGPGSRVKFPEALASGVPVVSTSVGAESFDASGYFERADDPRAFAEACLRVLAQREAASAMAAAAREYALSSLTWEQAARPLIDVLNTATR